MERRFAVATRLLEGAAVADVAKALKATRQRVHEDVSYLVEVGVLRKLSAQHAALRVEAGDYAQPWLRAAREMLSGDRRERSGAPDRPLGLPIRVHHWRWSRAFSSGPQAEPPWTRSANASGVESRWLVVEEGGQGFQVRAYIGPRVRRLQVSAPPATVMNGPAVIEAETRMGARARAVGESFARRYGFGLIGEWRASHPPEFAGPPVPGLAPFGAPGVDPVWADQSPGDGQVEIETRVPELAAAWADLPRSLARFDARLLRLEEDAPRVLARLERMLSLTERAFAPLLNVDGSLPDGELEKEGGRA